MSQASAASSLLLCNPQIPNFPPSLPSSLSFFSNTVSLTTTKPHLVSLSFPSHAQNPQFVSLYDNKQPQEYEQYDEFEDEDEYEEEEEEEEGQVIGDCLVFEDGVFEDPSIEQDFNPKIPALSKPVTKNKSKGKNTHLKKVTEIEPQNLVPEQWGHIVEEINMSKKERRVIAKEMEFGVRLGKKRFLRNGNYEEYMRFKNEKLSQLTPLVLDNPSGYGPRSGRFRGDGNEGALDREKESLDSSRVEPSSNTRVEPRNPRWAVYGRGLDDITEFFNSENYQPDADKPQGRQKLFSQEEKVLMNGRIPKLAVATSEKWLPLHTLAACGEFYLVNNLLKHNVDINAADQDGLTALHKAIICQKQAVANYLLRESAYPFVRDKDGATLMHYAVRTTSSQLIKTLLLYNVDINLQDNDGWTPLHLAVQSRRIDVVRLLLKKGADKTLKNKDGLTPVELCLHLGRDANTCMLVKLLKQLPRQPR